MLLKLVDGVEIRRLEGNPALESDLYVQNNLWAIRTSSKSSAGGSLTRHFRWGVVGVMVEGRQGVLTGCKPKSDLEEDAYRDLPGARERVAGFYLFGCDTLRLRLV